MYKKGKLKKPIQYSFTVLLLVFLIIYIQFQRKVSKQEGKKAENKHQLNK